ncbi:MAG: translocation/assembly module TamB, partial [Muribaculaceae bacterium]|nr:translocation/assembly module TamB [Muribaculaceae bacterium]
PRIEDFSGKIDDLKVSASDEMIKCAIGLLGSKVSSFKGLTQLNNLDLALGGELSMPLRKSQVKSNITTNLGRLSTEANIYWEGRNSINIAGNVAAEEIMLGTILNKNTFGEVTFDLNADVSVNNKNIEGSADASVSEFIINGISLADIALHIAKQGNELELNLEIADEIIEGEITGSALFAKEDSRWNLNGNVTKFIPSRLNLLNKYKDYKLACNVSAGLKGNNPDNMTGDVAITNFSFGKIGNRSLVMKSLNLTASDHDSIKEYKIDSDLIKGNLRGEFTFTDMINLGKELAGEVSPLYVTYRGDQQHSGEAQFECTLMPNANIADFFNLNIRPYTDIIMSGKANASQGIINFNLNAPYILKGKDKLIRNTAIGLSLERGVGFNGDIVSSVPAKNDIGDIHVSLGALNDKLSTDLSWTFEKNKTARGNISLEGFLAKNILTGSPEATLNINPSEFELNGSKWNIDRSQLFYADKAIDVDELRIWHAGQFVNIIGRASASPMDALKVKLAGIDLSYIFEALNINYVTFGGIATGEITASELFSKVPVLKTERLYVNDLSYNGAILGNGRLESHWINDLKKIAINADIRDNDHRTALVGGGIYLGKDSLAFDILADRVNVEFLKPFMSAFTSDVGGMASGRVKLYGTFKDIDLVGNVYADSISMKVDYTNVYYHGSDSVYIRPGEIKIPEFRLYDKYGNSGVLTGSVRHRYFHDPEFEFRLAGAQNLLAFDTNPHLNPDWYGKIFASGGGSLRGRPGYISMLMDVTTAPGSDFTFVLSETQTAGDYTFLSFTDKKKEELEALEGSVAVEEQLLKSLPDPVISLPSVFAMDIRCTATPGAGMTLVMDPKAGDKITARGEGPLQISYNTESDEMKIYGKYTLVEGNYNFSLQDLILRDFKIYSGSNISFNGDPMQGVLDITAAYRVNTNLSDLDKSFSTDRDLNRTNVPVDALLKVTGDMRSPEIGFDIALPTLTQDVERKVKSIISTEDMMSKQIIYLLALNRFYTPEYMGTTSNGGELASVASSTLSSQLSSFMGQLTDKVTLAPSFRSDKGDFSDMEVDLALSSRLLDNRLLINGNFGYRDRSTSQSTFIGDFDIEYLLNRNGGLRLKAYNHFNDQNYYLRSALTTQGIGVIYRRDFDNPFTFLKRKKRKNINKDGVTKSK